MITLPLTPDDDALIQKAIEVLMRNYRPFRHTVGCAVRCASGSIYLGINVAACGYGPCAEPVAIGAAFTAGEREIQTIVSVGRRDDGEFMVLSPCGNCRQLLMDYAPDCKVLFMDAGSIFKACARDLLPGSYISGFGEHRKQ
ncbi:MAG TPA: cytidine deaminase [Candidatus Sumerlaeota bacterium]|nr:cytidine deaminase [Candidatus Sumerlaeota bacterium]